MRGTLFKRFRHGRGRERKVRYPAAEAAEERRLQREMDRAAAKARGEDVGDDDDDDDDEGDGDGDGGEGDGSGGEDDVGGDGLAGRPTSGPGSGNVFVQYDGEFQYGARHGSDTSTVTFYYTLLGDYYQGTPVAATELLYANGDRYQGSVATTYCNGRPAADLFTSFGDGSDDVYEAMR